MHRAKKKTLMLIITRFLLTLHCGGVPNKCGNVKTVVPEEF
jgi:hypothetical protein